MKEKIKAHLITLPRWFAAPFFGSSLLMGVALAGDFCANAWIALAGGLLIMAGGHSWNTALDWMSGLDKPDKAGLRSVEKGYTIGQSVLATGLLSLKEVILNAVGWYVVALIPIIYLAISASFVVLPLAIVGMAITGWYAVGKFNWTHETALAVGVGPVAVLIGMFSVNPDPPWLTGLLVSVPVSIILCYLGLAFDEWPDAEANLKKGVKSLAFKVWEYGVSLEWYIMSWFLFALIYQVLLINIGVLAPMTAISFFTFPGIIACLVFLKADFEKAGNVIVLVAALYPILLLIGQVLGG